MSKGTSKDQFKQEAVAQITESGDPIKEVSKRPVPAYGDGARASAESESLRRMERFCKSSSNGGGT